MRALDPLGMFYINGKESTNSKTQYSYYYLNIEPSPNMVYLYLGTRFYFQTVTEFTTDGGAFVWYMSNFEDNYGFFTKSIDEFAIKIVKTADGSRYEYPIVRDCKPLFPMAIATNKLKCAYFFNQTDNVVFLYKHLFQMLPVDRLEYYKRRVFDNP